MNKMLAMNEVRSAVLDPIEDVIADLSAGRVVIVMDDKDRENEGDFVMAAEKATAQAVTFIVRYSSGLICQPMTRERLEELRLPLMVPENEASHQTAFTISVDYKHGTGTGISAADRARTARALADPACTAEDFSRPGHIFPLRAVRGGVLIRAGHTEAAVDLVRFAGLLPAAVICEIVNDDGTMKRGSELIAFAREHDLRIGSIADLIHYRKRREHAVAKSPNL